MRVPGDPELAAGPEAGPLVANEVLVEPHRVEVGARDVSPAAQSATVTSGTATSDDALLTPAEIRRRTRRYENWLRAQGLKRPEDATADLANPY